MRPRLAFATALAASMLVGTVAHAQTRVLTDSFEDGTVDAWEKDGGRDMCSVVETAVDGGTAHSGQRMAQCNWNGLVEWSDPQAYTTLMLSSWEYTSEFLVRFWVRYDADVDHKFGAKLFRLDAFNGSESYYLGGQMEQAGGPLWSFWELVNGQMGSIYSGDGPFGDGAWRKIEIYVRASDAPDGILRVWQDGTLVQEDTDLVTAPAGHHWYPMFIMSNWSINGPEWEHDDGNHTYWDDIEIYSDASTGTPATGSLADATATVAVGPGEGGGSSMSGSTTSSSGSSGSGASSGQGVGAATGAGGSSGDAPAEDSEDGCTMSHQQPRDGAWVLWLLAGAAWLERKRIRGSRGSHHPR